jgi:hypothetical protein
MNVSMKVGTAQCAFAHLAKPRTNAVSASHAKTGAIDGKATFG